MTPSNKDTEHPEFDSRGQWIMAGAILAYALTFFVVILLRHIVFTFSVYSLCNLFIQLAQYVREFRNLTTSRLVGGEDGGLGGQLVTTSPRPGHDATIINGSMSTVVDLQCQYNGHNMYNVTDGTNIPGVLLKSTNEVVG